LLHGRINPYGQFSLDLTPPFVPQSGVMAHPISPKKMAQRLARLLRPDYAYLKKAFQHTRTLLGVKPTKAKKTAPPASYRSGVDCVLRGGLAGP